MDPATIISEVTAARERLHSTAIIDPKKELADNIYPLLALMAESLKLRLGDVDERVELVEHTIADYLTASESMIRADMARRLVTVLGLGQMICKEAADALRAANVTPPDLLKKMEGYVHLSNAAMHEIADVTLEEDDGDDDDETGAEETSNG